MARTDDLHTLYTHLPEIRLRRNYKDTDEGIFGQHGQGYENDVYNIVNYYYSPYADGEVSGQRPPRTYASHLLRRQIEQITGYLASPGHQEITYEGAPEVVDVIKGVVNQCTRLMEVALLYGRGVMVLAPEAMTTGGLGITPIVMKPHAKRVDIYDRNDNLYSYEYNGVQMNGDGTIEDKDASGRSTSIESNGIGRLNAVGFVLDKGKGSAAQPYLARILSIVNATNMVLDSAIDTYSRMNRKFFMTTQALREEDRQRLAHGGVTMFEGDKDDVVEVGSLQKDSGSEALLQVLDRQLEKETGIVDYSRQDMGSDISGTALRYKLAGMDNATYALFEQYQDVTRQAVDIAMELLGQSADYTINFTKNTPRSKIDEVETLQVAGASLYTRFERLGLDPDIELERLRAEQDITGGY